MISVRQIYLHEASGKTFSTKEIAEAYDKKWQESKEDQIRKFKEKQAIVASINKQLTKYRRQLRGLAQLTKEHMEKEKQFVSSYSKVNTCINEMNKAETIINKQKLALKLLSASLVNQKKEAVKQYRKISKFDPNKLSRLRNKIDNLEFKRYRL